MRAHERLLLVDGQPTVLGARAFDLLLALVDQPGLLLTKHNLMDQVWPGLVVQENNLAAQISALRKVLGADLIATIPGRGYCFTGLAEAAPPRSPPLSALASPAHAAQRTNLPTQLGPLIGREADLAVLGSLVPAQRLVTLVGAGGMGKTRLAQAFLHQQRGAWKHGVCWVELAAITDPQSLPDAIAAALGVRPGSGEPLAALCASLASLQLLVVLDNAEHQLPAVGRLTQALLAAAPGLHLIVTSQAPLASAAERVFRLDALAVPSGPLPAAQALGFGAIELFAERAKGIDPHFALTDANAPMVTELCAALDGLPLAIELAAARVHLMGVQRLLASMQDRLRLLTRNLNRSAPPRQQTLRTTLAWSHDLLEPVEQRVFRRLGVLAGSASFSFVQRVVTGRPDPDQSPAVLTDECALTNECAVIDEWAVIDALGVLVERCLLTVVSADDGTEPRYRLLESSRAFARERLQAAGEAEALRAHCAQALADKFDAQWTERSSGRAGLRAWDLQVGRSADNAREAIAWATAAQQTKVMLKIAATWLQAIPWSLHRERMALADACDALNTPALPPALRLRVALVLARTWTNFRKRRGIAAAAQALSLARAMDAHEPDRWMLYRALSQWVESASGLDDADPELLAAAMAEVQALEDPTWPAIRLLAGHNAWLLYLSRPGPCAHSATDYLRAARQIADTARAAGDVQTSQLGNLVDAQLRAGETQAAIHTGQSLLAHLEGSREESSLAYARLNLGAALLALDDTQQAGPVLRAGWQQALAFDLQPYYADYLALLAALGGRHPAAALLAGYADAANRAVGDNREANEAAAIARARTLAGAALGADLLARLQAEGETLRDTQISALAFGAADSADFSLAAAQRLQA